jgi:type IV secretion system protein VirD4
MAEATQATAAPGGRRAQAAPKRSPTPKRIAIAAAVVAYLGLAALGTAYVGTGGYLFIVHKQVPRDLSVRMLPELWEETAEHPRMRKKLKVSLLVAGFTLFAGIPLAILGATGHKRELHGSARWANHAEIRAAGLLSDEPGIVVGKLGNRYLTLPGQQSAMVSAPTRSWKGVAIVVPNCLSFRDSIVCADIKEENYRITAGFRAKCGQKVFKWAPFAEDGRSHRWNPLATIRAEERHRVGDILEIGQILYPSQGGSDNDKFFNAQARNLFLGLALYLLETPELPRTIGELLRQSSGKGLPIGDHMRKLMADRAAAGRPLSDPCVDALSRFLSTSDNTLASIKATFDAPLTVFADTFVDAATSGDDIRLHDLRRTRMSVYVVIPPKKLADAGVLLNLFFSQAINCNTDKLPEDDPSIKHQALLILDEATSMGRVSALSKGISYIAGYGLRVLTVIQAMSQLDSTYGKDEARTFATNHALQIMYAPREQRDANEYSEALGTFTEKSESRGRSVSHAAKGGASTSRNISPQRRPLLLPQEFKELGIRREVIMLENCKPILAEKICYYEDPVFQARLFEPPLAPLIDLDAQRARVEQRVRLAEADEAFTLEQLAGDFGRMPHLPEAPTQDDLRNWVDAFFECGAVEMGSAAPTTADAGPAGHIDEDGVINAVDEERSVS